MKSNYFLIFIGLIILIALAVWAFHRSETEWTPSSDQQNSSLNVEESSSGDSIQSDESFISNEASSSHLEEDRKDKTDALLRVSRSIKPNIVGSDLLDTATDNSYRFDEATAGFESIHPEARIYFEGTSYLSDEDLARYAPLEETQLLALAEAGDVGAQVILGVRLIKVHNNVTDGMFWLMEAASYGSFEALRELRWIYQFGAGPIEKDDFAFLAWAKVAYMIGDWQALWHQGASSRVTRQELMVVDVLAAYYFNEINTRHVLRTGGNLEVTIRPGFKQALDQYMDY